MANVAGAKEKRPAGPPRNTRPNIVVIQLDDMRTEDWTVLRSTQKALRGASWFPNYVIGYPYCAASRASLLTGQYAHNHGVVSPNESECMAQWQKRQHDRIALGRVLNDAGYRTGMFGKFINGYNPRTPQPGGWDRWVGASKGGHFGGDLVVDGKVVFSGLSDFTTRLLVQYAGAFIDETPEDKPLFMLFSPNEPHGPIQIEPRYRKKFATVGLPRKAWFNEADVSDKPAYVASLPLLGKAEIADLEEWNRGRMRLMLSVDTILAQLFRQLEAAGRRRNTCIFIVSDNGYMLGEHRLTAKHAPYTPSAVVPMLAWGAPFAAGNDSRLVSNVDIAPTCAELAGTAMPRADGFSLLGDRSREFVPMYRYPVKGRGGAGLRSADLLYFELDTGEREYYDLRNDPMELNNLLPPGFSGEVTPPGLPGSTALRLWTAAFGSCTGKGCSRPG
jgi:arylsulfatase A-like enzyme